jgi:peptide/nickel transport system ATP-binding protein
MDPDRYLDRLPRELSGGEKQRVSIARALVTEPDVILADEPASMLDVSTQASILNLLNRLSADLGVSIIYISHDLSTVGHLCERVNVMYLGRIVESGVTEQLLNEPKHPYTEALVNAIPIPDPLHKRERTNVEDTPRDPINIGEGCRFRDRCPERMDVCDYTPHTVESETDHQVACHLYYDHEEGSQ